MKWILAFILLAGAAQAEPAFRVIDGDTISVDGSTYRLLGFDTPETFYARCPAELELGKRAATHLMELMTSGPWRIDDSGRRDRYLRKLGRLYIGDREAADLMIEAGLARAYRGKKRDGWC